MIFVGTCCGDNAHCFPSAFSINVVLDLDSESVATNSYFRLFNGTYAEEVLVQIPEIFPRYAVMSHTDELPDGMGRY